MPFRRYNIPMATEADGLRFRLLWATIQDDNNVVSAEAMERGNPFVQSIMVEIHDDYDDFDNWLLGMSLEQFRSNHAPEPRPGFREPASAAVFALSWQRTLPVGTRVGSWVHQGNQRFQVTRIDPAQGLVWLRDENGMEFTINLEDSGALSHSPPALPPKTEQPNPDSIWARLLEPSSFDD